MATHTMQPTVDRARHRVSSHAVAPTMGGNWRRGPVGRAGGATGVFTTGCTAYATGLNPAADADAYTIKRPARHLGTRST
jgi:hypothetical protein